MSTACLSDGLDELIRKTGFWTTFELRNSPLPSKTFSLSFSTHLGVQTLARSIWKRSQLPDAFLDWPKDYSSIGSTKGTLDWLRNLKKVTANISSTFCMPQGSTDSVCGLSTSSALASHVHLRQHGGPRVNRSRSAAPGNVAAGKLRTNERQTLLFYYRKRGSASYIVRQ